MSLPYLPARLRKLSRWDIIFYQTNPKTRQRERIRHTYDLNRIRNKRERLKIAKQKVAEINAKLPFGYPFEAQYDGIKQKSLTEAVEYARRLKTVNDSPESRNSYNSIVRIFLEFLKIRKLLGLMAHEFRFHHAQDFMDHLLLERTLSNTTYNNYLQYMRSVFTLLLERKFINENPFKDIRKRKPEQKKRRAFNDYEKSVIASYAYEHDKMLFLAILLQYHCFIRPTEIRQLRFEYFDLRQGLIRLPAKVTKNNENAIVTIPNDLVPLLVELGLDDQRTNWLIFGKGNRPNRDTPIGKNTLGNRHRKVLDILHRKGVLKNIEGLMLYSWKDTGALELFKNKVNILEVMRQLRHKDLNTTQKYCQSLYMVNSEIKQLSNPLIDLKRGA